MHRIQSRLFVVFYLSNLPLLEGRLRATGVSRHAIPLANTENEGLRGAIAHKSARALQQLVGYGGAPSDEYFPLKFCEGDCDTDEDVSTVDHELARVKSCVDKSNFLLLC